MKPYIKTLLITALAMGLYTAAQGQCNNNNFTISSATVCGNEEVTFSIVNPNPNADYFWNFGQGGGVSANGPVVTHTYPARDFNKTYNVTVFNNSGACMQQVTVLSTPDASITAVTGAMVDDHTIAYCSSTTDFPQFNLTIQNASGTLPHNTSYTVDWGDGTPPFTGTNFTTLSHTYATQGMFELLLTVEGNLNCPSSTVAYTVFNSSDPGGSIVNTTNTITTCYPHTIGYPILGTSNNIPGTTYQISISGEPVAFFNHPPPDTFYHTFNETSCAQGVYPFDANEFVIQMEVISPCQNKLSFVTARLGTPPLAGFDMVPAVICQGQNLVLTNTSDGSMSVTNLCSEIQGANWMIEPRTYNIVSGDTINSEVLEVQLLEEVPYTITMWIENMCGTDTAVQVIQPGVNPVADAVATLNQPNACAPVTATFENLSTTTSEDPLVTYNWSVSPSNGASFTSGTNASSFEPEIVFNGAGIYTVTLTVSNECGSPTWSTSFDIRNKPGVDLPAIGNLCADSFTYVPAAVISGNPDQVNWVFTGGTPATFNGANPPSVVFSGTGNYSVSVTAGNTCGDSTVTRNFSLSDPIPIDAGADLSACFNGPPVTLGGFPAGGTWSGTGVSGNSVDPVATGTGNHTLTYTYDNGICSVSDAIAFTVIGIDGLTAGPDETACINGMAFELSGATPAGGSWSGPGIVSSTGTFDPSVAGPGAAVVAYTFTEPVLGCTDTAYKLVDVLETAVIQVSGPDTVCLGAPADFTVTLPSGGNAIWDFGDGNPVTGGQATHAFTAAGSQWVGIQVSTNAGCASSDSVEVMVLDVPQAGFLIDNALGCGDLVTGFENTTAGLAESVLWDFGTGATSVEYAPQNISFPPGMYNDTAYYITLTALNRCGSDAATDSVFVTKRPVALFGTQVNSVCPGQPLYINNISYNSPDGYFWDFGNGLTSNEVQPAPQYYPVPDRDTIYQIMLVSWNECGSDTLIKDIRVKTVNVVSFFNTDPLTGCEPLEVDFINYSTVSAWPVWDFGDGNTSTHDTITHVFQQAGVYTVTLAVDNGCSRDTSQAIVTVIESPQIDFTGPELGCQQAEVAFTNQSSGAFGFVWDFGDGQGSTLNHPRHTYTGAGNFNVTLTGENQHGCTASVIKGITVVQKPHADFNADRNNLCAGLEVQFNSLSVFAENFAWNFGDGTASFIENPRKRYDGPGVYDVTLVVNNDNFCYDSITYEGVVEVWPNPDADFDFYQTPEGERYGDVAFTNLSDGNYEFTWDFGDGTGSLDAEPTHRYAQSGQYLVQLNAENQYLCRDSASRYINVNFFGKLFVPNAFSPALNDLSGASVFLPKGVGLVEYEMEIYSSYGELLWKTSELLDGKPAVGWDGSARGKAMPQDVYIWKIRAKFDNGLSWEGAEVKEGVKTTVGTLTLIR